MKHKNNVEVRRIGVSETDKVFQLIWETFQDFVAPDYTQEGIDQFYSEFIQGETFRKKVTEGTESMYGAYWNGVLAGVLLISPNHTISCIFVKGCYHRKGIGSELLHTVMKELYQQGVEKIKLNASPYAVPFYHKMGFTDTGVQSVYKGIVYTPMELRYDKLSMQKRQNNDSSKKD